MTDKRVLVVDDEPDIRELLELTLNRMGLDTHTASSYQQALSLLDTSRPFDLCLTDMKLPDGDGLALIEHIQAHHPKLPVAMITAYGSMDTAIAALKAGAFDFVSKPLELPRLRKLVDFALSLADTRQIGSAGESRLTGNSSAITAVREKIGKLARSQAPVYISGESGSGKELAARLIHANSSRSDGPFVPVNCGAIPGELMESEFFGHRKGSFTGAHADKQGLFQAADGGTLFLDEVADLPLAMQVKLLRAIQEKAIRPIGSAQEVPIDVRILSATHKDLSAEVQAERFRSDLFYRINVIELQMPSLRERQEDIPQLAQSILTKLADQSASPPIRMDASALKALQGYPFPGNVRELENILERASTLCEGNTITASDLNLGSQTIPASTDSTPGSSTMDHALPERGNHSLEDYLEQIERKLITDALESCRWNRTAAADKLGISFRALRYRLKKLGIE
ncbi:MAG: sigma-54-dependent Fis family transcriptional regulator [Gammaproteobacteria bacterium]|nr:MAG: sigma-54-dependent Fis family transcriptional regulator [Gammaproteobacteria bacterium]